MTGETTSGCKSKSILGLGWNKWEDVTDVIVPEKKVVFTKRGELRKLAKTNDPLGFASPQTLREKFIYREVCTSKLAWDVTLTSEMTSEIRYFNQRCTSLNFLVEYLAHLLNRRKRITVGRMTIVKKLQTESSSGPAEI